MLENRTKRLVYRLLSGKAYLKVDGKLLIYRPPCADLLHRADFVWQEAYYNGLKLNFFTKDDAEEWLVNNGFWDSAAEADMKSLPEQIDSRKVDLYYAWSQKSETSVKVHRKILEGLRKKINKLHLKKYSIYESTADCWADLAVKHFIYNQCVTYEDGTKLELSEDSVLFQKVYNNIEEIGSEEYKKIARSSEWLNYWGYRGEHFFGLPANMINQEQLYIWNACKIYESAYQHPNCPPAEVLDDVDLFDGWLIVQSRKSESDIAKREIDKQLDKAGVKGGNIFVVAKDREDAKRIHNMNNAANKMVAQNFLGTLNDKAKK